MKIYKFKNKIDILLFHDKVMQFVRLYTCRDLVLKPYDAYDGVINDYPNCPNGVTYQHDKDYYNDVEKWIADCNEKHLKATGHVLYYNIQYVN